MMSDNRSYTILAAPSILGLRPTGVERMPEALRRAGLYSHLDAIDAGTLTPPPYDPVRDPHTHLLNGPALRAYACMLARTLAALPDDGRLPIVLGGDCSILLGCLLAQRGKGRTGLAFIDGHTDFYAPKESPTGEVADMELGFVTGRGPELLANLDGQGALMQDEDVIAIGFRDHHEVREVGGRDVGDTVITCLDLPALRRVGLGSAITNIVQHLTQLRLSRFWVHLDADVLDDTIFPAVDYRLPGGLEPAEVSLLLRALVRTKRVAGLSVTIYNPALDPSGCCAQLLVETLVSGLVPDR